jgi:hypothetical protein
MRARAELAEALARQSEELGQQHARVLEERLSEQYHELYTQLAKDKVSGFIFHF